MGAFFRFPHTPHLTWLGNARPRDDKVLTPAEVQQLLVHPVVVEEKVDGANLGLSVDDSGIVHAQNRGTYLPLDDLHGQFKPLKRWLQPRMHALVDELSPDLILFGEWCYAVHSIRYTRLPDWFLAFDVYDRRRTEFWSVPRRDALVRKLALALVPQLGAGVFDIPTLTGLLRHSQLAVGPAEGLYVRRDEDDRLVARAKLVRPEFVQAIGEHWSRRVLRTNALARDHGGERAAH